MDWNVACDSGFFSNGLGDCVPCSLCLKLSRQPRGCETCEFSTTTELQVTTTRRSTTRLPTTRTSTTPDVNRIKHTTAVTFSKTSHYNTVVTGSSYLPWIRWSPVVIVALGICVIICLVIWAIRRQNIHYKPQDKIQRRPSVRPLPLQMCVQYNLQTGSSETVIYDNQQAQLQAQTVAPRKLEMNMDDRVLNAHKYEPSGRSAVEHSHTSQPNQRISEGGGPPPYNTIVTEVNIKKYCPCSCVSIY
ncbi:uncharacterized protein LOC144435778 [Glandiceps talaboti]